MRATLIALAVVWTVCALPGCASGPPTAEIAREIQKLGKSSFVAEEALSEQTAVARFYQARKSRPAWLAHADEIVTAIQGMAADGLDPADYHLATIQSLLAKRRSKTPTAPREAALDVLLSDAVASMADDIQYGRVRPSEVNPEWNADPRDGASPLDSTLTEIAKSGRVRAAIDALRPTHFIYRGLMETLARLREIEAHGGWQTVRLGKDLRPGATDPRVAVVRRRLLIGGDAEGGIPRDSTRYDAALERAVKSFQARHRIEASGVVNGPTVVAMNVSAEERLAQVRANLERARWVLGGLGEDFMLVNLPAFKAYLIRGNRNVWETRTQIGQEAMQTPTFRAKIRTVVFNPDWSVPQTILENEILEEMRSGKNVVDEQGLVIYDRSNNVVDPASIHWSSVTPDDFPYSIRQPAGDDNALGKVKFLFPNKYSIYLHDTPSRHLFAADRRTFSHGCIRIENPLDLAEQLLQGQHGWDREKIDRVVESDSTLNVALEHPLPILIVYWTVSVGASGEVRYAEDIYHLDPPLLAALDRRSRRE